MRSLLYILMILTSFLWSNNALSQSLKGISVEEKYNGPLEIKTTVAGLNGIIYIARLKYNTVYLVHFVSKLPILNEIEYVRAQHVADEFKDNIESHYNIFFDSGSWKHEELLKNKLFSDVMVKNVGDV